MYTRVTIMVTTLAVMLTMLIPNHIRAESAITKLSDEAIRSKNACQGIEPRLKITTLAKHIVSDQVTIEISNCYYSLSDKDKARVFEAMAAQRGLLEQLRKETSENKRHLQEQAGPVIAAAWQQLVERIPFSAVGKTLRSVTNSYPDQYCDGSDPDVDYTFVVDFPYAVSNPDSLRSFAGVTGVDAMLTYYQVVYGGINGRGNTTSGRVYLCIGDNGVSTAGGEQTVRDNLKLHDNN